MADTGILIALMTKMLRAYNISNMHKSNSEITNRIDAAIAAHGVFVQHFRQRLASAAFQAFDINELGDSRSCALGKWLATPEARAILGDGYGEIELKHNEFHHAVRFIAQKFNDGPSSLSASKLAQYVDAFESVSQSLVALLEVAKLRQS